MVQSYLKKVGHRTFTANKKGRNREFFPHFPSPFAFLLQRRRIATSGLQFQPMASKSQNSFLKTIFQYPMTQISSPLRLKIGLQLSIVHCPLSVQIACKIEYQKDDFRIILTNPDFASVNMHFLTMADGDGRMAFISLIIKL